MEREDCRQPFYNRGLEQQAKGDLDGAIASYTNAIRLDPNNAKRIGAGLFSAAEKGAQKDDRADADNDQRPPRHKTI
jgi:tetratricopeptide (TPR) repeat protein